LRSGSTEKLWWQIALKDLRLSAGNGVEIQTYKRQDAISHRLDLSLDVMVISQGPLKVLVSLSAI